jgi:hypothetical protein
MPLSVLFLFLSQNQISQEQELVCDSVGDIFTGWWEVVLLSRGAPRWGGGGGGGAGESPPAEQSRGEKRRGEERESIVGAKRVHMCAVSSVVHATARAAVLV